MPFTLHDLEARLATHAPRTAARLGGRRASVAALLRDAAGGAGPEVLLMKRRERSGDRWSGHVSFPGGMEAPGDEDLLATAVRETFEEVGVDLRRSARLVGRLDSLRAIARGRILPMTITPHVFVCTEDTCAVPGDEAESCFWFPLVAAAAGSLDGTFPYGPLNLPCWNYDGYVVWGLTYQMIRGLMTVAG